MKTYTNSIEINGQTFTHTVEANTFKEALAINKQRKSKLPPGRRIFGRLLKN